MLSLVLISTEEALLMLDCLWRSFITGLKKTLLFTLILEDLTSLGLMEEKDILTLKEDWTDPFTTHYG